MMRKQLKLCTTWENNSLYNICIHYKYVWHGKTIGIYIYCKFMKFLSTHDPRHLPCSQHYFINPRTPVPSHHVTSKSRYQEALFRLPTLLPPYSVLSLITRSELTTIVLPLFRFLTFRKSDLKCFCWYLGPPSILTAVWSPLWNNIRQGRFTLVHFCTFMFFLTVLPQFSHFHILFLRIIQEHINCCTGLFNLFNIMMLFDITSFINNSQFENVTHLLVVVIIKFLFHCTQFQNAILFICL